MITQYYCVVDPASHNDVSYNVNIIIISVAISVTLFLAVSAVVIAGICLYHKYKLSASKALPDGTAATYQQPQPVYETVMESTTVDLEMTENVAYGPIHTHTLKKNINIS